MKSIGLGNKRKYNRINYLLDKYGSMIDMDKWRKNRYKSFVNVVNSNYMMTRWQKIQAKECIDKFGREGISQLPYSYETIVTGICFYYMIKDGRAKELRFNTNFLISVGLTKNKYRVISEKIKSAS